MAIINNAHRGSQINLLCLIYRVIRRAKSPLTDDEIIDICRPETLLRKTDHKKRFTGELSFWKDPQHQLWKNNDENKLELKFVTSSENPTPMDIANITRAALFAINIDDIMGDNEHDIESLLRTLSCILASGRFLPIDNATIDKQSLDALLSELLPNHPLNDSEKPTLLEYGQFLGFLEPYKGCYFVDPTNAVLSVLPNIFTDVNTLTIKEFLKKLGGYIPILDNGDYQIQVKQVMSQHGWSPDKESNISSALSHALARLSLDKVLRYETTSDDPQAMNMQLPTRSQLVSTISFMGGMSDA